MAKFYAIQIKLKNITIDNVPEKWQDAAKALI